MESDAHWGNKYKNLNYTSTRIGSELLLAKETRDLGILEDSTMKMLTLCTAAGEKVNSRLGGLWEDIKNKAANVIMSLYKIYV